MLRGSARLVARASLLRSSPSPSPSPLPSPFALLRSSSAAPSAFARGAATSASTSAPAEVVQFPGAHRSAYTETLRFLKNDAAIPTYRVLDREGKVIQNEETPDVRDSPHEDPREDSAKIHADPATMKTRRNAVMERNAERKRREKARRGEGRRSARETLKER